jgi:hypothetical protein
VASLCYQCSVFSAFSVSALCTARVYKAYGSTTSNSCNDLITAVCMKRVQFCSEVREDVDTHNMIITRELGLNGPVSAPSNRLFRSLPSLFLSFGL